MGHGTAHAVFFGLSILAPAFGRATYYTQSCKQMPLFLVTGIFIVIQLGLTTLLFLVKYYSFIVGILYLVEKFVASFQTSYTYQVLENCSCITLSLSFNPSHFNMKLMVKMLVPVIFYSIDHSRILSSSHFLNDNCLQWLHNAQPHSTALCACYASWCITLGKISIMLIYSH